MAYRSFRASVTGTESETVSYMVSDKRIPKNEAILETDKTEPC